MPDEPPVITASGRRSGSVAFPFSNATSSVPLGDTPARGRSSNLARHRVQEPSLASVATPSEPPASEPPAEPDQIVGGGVAGDTLAAQPVPARGLGSLAPLRHRNYALLWA